MSVSDSGQAGALEIDITPAMISAGLSAYDFAFGSFPEANFVEYLYTAMEQARVVPIDFRAGPNSHCDRQ